MHDQPYTRTAHRIRAVQVTRRGPHTPTRGATPGEIVGPNNVPTPQDHGRYPPKPILQQPDSGQQGLYPLLPVATAFAVSLQAKIF